MNSVYYFSRYGRQFVFYFAIIVVTIGRIISIMVTSNFFWFASGIAIAGIAVNSVFTSPYIISMEISSEWVLFYSWTVFENMLIFSHERTNIAMCQSLGWSISTTVLPLLFWWLRDWVPFMWITTLPIVLVLLFHKWVFCVRFCFVASYLMSKLMKTCSCKFHEVKQVIQLVFICHKGLVSIQTFCCGK